MQKTSTLRSRANKWILNLINKFIVILKHDQSLKIRSQELSNSVEDNRPTHVTL